MAGSATKEEAREAKQILSELAQYVQDTVTVGNGVAAEKVAKLNEFLDRAERKLPTLSAIEHDNAKRRLKYKKEVITAANKAAAKK